MALRQTVRSQFEKFRVEKDEETIHAAKANAVRALSNYMLQRAGPKDPKVKAAMKDFQSRVMKQTKQDDIKAKEKKEQLAYIAGLAKSS
jgi:hypothetical protein